MIELWIDEDVTIKHVFGRGSLSTESDEIMGD